MLERHALVVEDDPSARRLLELLLVRMGFRVHATDEGRAAVTLIAETAFDLACVDLGLPTISGFEVCEALRTSAQNKTAPILITTGRYLPQDRALAISLGANGYLLKPFTPGQFRAAVSALVGLPLEAPRQLAR